MNLGDITAAVTEASASPTGTASSDPAASPATTAAAATLPDGEASAPGTTAAAAGRRTSAAATTGKASPSAPGTAATTQAPADIDIEAIFKANRAISPATARKMIEQTSRTHGTAQASAVADAIKARETELLGLTGAPDEQTLREYNIRHYVDMLLNNPRGLQRWLNATLDVPATGTTTAPPATGQPAASPKAPIAIEPDYKTSDGKGVFSADRVHELLAQHTALITENLTKDFETRFGPVVQTADNLRAAERDQQATKFASDVMAKAAKWEGFDELRPKIQEIWKKSPKLTLHEAYIEAHSQFFVPTRTERERKKFLEELKTAKPVKTESPSRMARDGATAPVRRGMDVRGAVQDALDKHAS